MCLRSGTGVVVDRKATAHETPGSDAVQNVELVSAESTCTALARAHIVQCRGILATHFPSRAGWYRCEWMVHMPAPAQAEHGRRAGRQCDRWQLPGAALTATRSLQYFPGIGRKLTRRLSAAHPHSHAQKLLWAYDAPSGKRSLVERDCPDFCQHASNTVRSRFLTP